MIEVYKIESSSDTPRVILDPLNNKFEIEGNSLPENVIVFYNPILEWLKEYSKEPNDETLFEIKMNYFNTSSSKILLDILYELEEITDEGGIVKIHWYYQEKDSDMKGAGEEYADIVDIPFEHFSW